MAHGIQQGRTSLVSVFLSFLKLGLTSFGGPIAHIGYFRNEFVIKKRWIDEQAYGDLVALCQFLPGPASSQVGMAIGLSRAGILGAIVAWVGFTLPSAFLLTGFGLWFSHSNGNFGSGGGLHGLKLVAVPVVAQAILGMGKNLCPDRSRLILAVLSSLIVSWIPSSLVQVVVILGGGVLGMIFLRKGATLPHTSIQVRVGRFPGLMALSLYIAFLVFLPWAADATGSRALQVVAGFYRAGALVFGGGHVVLPLLESVTVSPGWVSKDAFMAGYGAAQAVPGPLFTFAAYLGSVFSSPPSSWKGAFLCLVSIFLPSFLLVVGVLPFWEKLRNHPAMRSTVQGINAVVVGLLLSAFYNPVWVSAVKTPVDFSLVVLSFLLLVFWRFPSWSVVLLNVLFGIFLELNRF